LLWASSFSWYAFLVSFVTYEFIFIMCSQSFSTPLFQVFFFAPSSALCHLLVCALLLFFSISPCFVQY
jgi:hypothetical protein